MSQKREKVVVAMSGGVDSSVAAALLVEAGYDVVGLFMRTGVKEPVEPAGLGQRSAVPLKPAAREHRGCCSASDASDARFVAGMLGIPFYALNFEEEFDELIDYFADEYVKGRTPNPCVVCNNKLKFGRLVEYADAVGAWYIATGHYARIERREAPDSEIETCNGRPSRTLAPNGQTRLLRAVDAKKDQSYVLFGLDRRVLDRVLFPIGHLEKSDVRHIAARYGFPNQDKPDSVEICFVPDRNYARLVRERRPESFYEGDVLDDSGNIIGRHPGIGHYTIGQRRGLGIAAGHPVYVTHIDAAHNTVTLSVADTLLSPGLIAERVNFLSSPRGATGGLPDVAFHSFRADVKIRYLHKAAAATVYNGESGGSRAVVVFDEPQRAITPGQAAVFYTGDMVIGGGWIERACTADEIGSSAATARAANR